MELTLAIIGWFFTIASAVAIVAGAIMIQAMHRAGETERQRLARTAWNDMLLFGIWFLGLAGGIGVIMVQPWGRAMLEFFCWVLAVLIVLSAGQRLRGLRQQEFERPVSWAGAFTGIALFAVPLVALCAATIITLRSDAVRQVFGG